ncbi:MAG TPA: peptidoglycan DD-metalloendopeptidase family protein [Candidatus Binatia bacterium]|nr:peptidoglycan DD-metalloendopeptidase family protein [Candidatus Binatia bacterium]
MNRRSSLLWVLLFFYGLRLDAASVNKDLEGIKRKIERERQGINQVRKREGSVLQALGKIERDLEKKTKDLNMASSKLASILDEMQQKETEAQRLRISLDQRRELLMKRAVALYRWHRGGGPFVLFSGEVPLGVLLQRKHYLETTVLFDRELVEKLNGEVTYQENVKRELAHKKEELSQQRRILAEVQDSVRKDGEKKKQLLASLRQEKDGRVRALKELEQAALRLQKMIEEMSRRGVGKAPQLPAGTGLDAMRGKLEWPVRGEVTGGFGKTKHPEFATEVFRKGIDIEAPIGEEIRAVEKGRVVFAERFSGYGRMVIIDHGERYFSIYAHLSEILKKTGDMVKRGETLGRAGDSDSLAGSRLYFEMRKDGKSIDPLPWFQK